MVPTVTAIADDVVYIAGLAVRNLRPNRITGEPVVLLHGIFSDATTLERLGRELALSGHEVWLPTLHEYTVSANIKKAVAITRHASLHGKVILIGHSEGCVYASEVCQRLGSSVSGVIHIAPRVNGYPMTLQASVAFPKYVPEIFVSALTGAEVKLRQSDVSRLFANNSPVGMVEMQTEKPFVMLEAALGFRTIKPVDVPSLVIAPKDDHLVRSPASLAQKVGAKLVSVSGDHMVPVARPETVAGIVESWLERI